MFSHQPYKAKKENIPGYQSLELTTQQRSKVLKIEVTYFNKYKQMSKPKCHVCFDEITEDLQFTPCIHSFHGKCLEPWIRMNIQTRPIPCPVCKYDISDLLGDSAEQPQFSISGVFATNRLIDEISRLINLSTQQDRQQDDLNLVIERIRTHNSRLRAILLRHSVLVPGDPLAEM